jgi:hypothetical protein
VSSPLGKKGSGNRARNTAVTLIAAMVILSALAIILANQLPWPLPAEVQSLRQNNSSQPDITSPKNPLNSSLLIVALAALSKNSSSDANSSGPTGPNSSSAAQAIAGAALTVYTPTTKGRIVIAATGLTQSNGVHLFLISPGTYQVKLTSSFGNAITSVTVNKGNTTQLTIEFNESSYSSHFFQISSNSPSKDLIAPWDDLFLTVPPNPPISESANYSIFLSFELLASNNNNVTSSPEYATQIISQSSNLPTEGTWLELRLPEAANITGIVSVSVHIYRALFTEKEYPFISEVSSNPGNSTTS